MKGRMMRGLAIAVSLMMIVCLLPACGAGSGDKSAADMTPEEVLDYPARVFEALPEDFSGKLLEVPVGTGVLSLPVFKTMPDADIMCLDYSEKMMETAEKRADELAVKNVTFRQGDVGNLPFSDEVFDAVVSMNGFHAFPDKDAAFLETWRVLKKGGIFTGCYYIKGINRRTDTLIRTLYVPAGFFTPPFDTMESLKKRLSSMYSEVSVDHVQSIVLFRCIK